MLAESAAHQQTMADAITLFNNLLTDGAANVTTQVGGNVFPADAYYTNFAQLADTQISL